MLTIPSHQQKSRNRILYLALALCVVFIGLASRHIHGLFPQFLGKYPGDALWTLMVFFGLGWLLPQGSTARLATYALTISFVVEFTQLYQAPWINAIRSTAIGHLVLGSGFGWIDFIAYTVGASIGLGADTALNSILGRLSKCKSPIQSSTHSSVTAIQIEN